MTQIIIKRQPHRKELCPRCHEMTYCVDCGSCSECHLTRCCEEHQIEFDNVNEAYEHVKLYHAN